MVIDGPPHRARYEDIDPTHGWTRADLETVAAPDAPDGFAEYWRARRRDADIDPRPRRTGIRVLTDGATVADVDFATTGGLRLGGWLRVPAGRVDRGVVIGHGYAGRAAPDAPPELPTAAVLWFCARGLPDRGLVPGIPADAAEHVLHGIDDRAAYVLGGCVDDTWAAVSALIDLVPAAARIDYVGESFGGGVGALAVPWDDRIAAACLSIPSFGHQRLRASLPSIGSAESIRLHAADRPAVHETLRWFDAATAARFARQPALMAVALADPAVAPPGQFAIANAWGGPVERVVLASGHMPHPDAEAEASALRAAQTAFLAARPVATT